MQSGVPRRATRSYVQELEGSPQRVFGLLCPERERDWIEGWEPDWILASQGVAELDCVFATQDGGHQALWYVSRHEPEAGRVEMIKWLPGRSVCRLSIQLAARPAGCSAEVTYRLTSLGPQGDLDVEAFDEAHFRGFMKLWERRLNHYLRHGSALKEP